MKIHGATVLLTGATGGIGHAIARLRLDARFGSVFPSINDAAQRKAGAAEMVAKHAYND